MRDPDAQFVFDTTVRFLSKQGGRSVRGARPVPAFYGVGNRRCAIGMYIPRPFYEGWKMEGRGIADLTHIHHGTQNPIFPGLMRARPWFRTHEDLLRSLMLAHDSGQAATGDSRHTLLNFVSADPIVNRLRAVARKHGLADAVIDELPWPELWL